MTPLFVLHVGLGQTGLPCLSAVSGSGRFEPVGLVEIDLGRLEAARDRSGLAPAECFDDLAEAMATCAPDAVVITVPLALRAEFVIQALAADLHVLVEAPLAPSEEEARRCVTIAMNRGLRLMLLPAGPSLDRLLEEFYLYVMEGVESPTSGRRMLAPP